MGASEPSWQPDLCLLHPQGFAVAVVRSYTHFYFQFPHTTVTGGGSRGTGRAWWRSSTAIVAAAVDVGDQVTAVKTSIQHPSTVLCCCCCCCSSFYDDGDQLSSIVADWICHPDDDRGQHKRTQQRNPIRSKLPQSAPGSLSVLQHRTN